MEGREAMAFPGAHHHHHHHHHPLIFMPGGAFTSIAQSASVVHAPPSLTPMSNPNLQHPFSFGDQGHHHQEFVDHGIHMGMASSSSSPTMESPVVKKKRGRPRKYVPDSDNQVALGLSPMETKNDSSSMPDSNEPKRARGRPPGTGRKQRLADVGPWMNTSAGLAFAPHVISVEAGEDIVSKVFSFSQQRPRALCIMSGTGTVSSVTLHQPGTSELSRCFQGSLEILSLGGSYLVNEEGGPKTRTGGISVSLSRADGSLVGGGAVNLIAGSLVQVVACSFVYGSAKAKAIKQGNGSKEDKSNNMETTPTSEPSPTPATEEAEPEVAEADQTQLDYSSPGWSSGGNRSIDDSRNHNHLTDIELTRG